MSRPDPSRIARQAEMVVLANAGETALLRSFVSAAGGVAQYGVQKSNYYTPTVITGAFSVQRAGLGMAQERQAAGGLVMGERLYLTTLSALSPRDELVWRGTAYRADGAPTPQNIGGRVLWQIPLALLGVTG